MEKILIVDDHPVVIEAVRIILSRAFSHFSYVSAGSATETRRLIGSMNETGSSGIKLAFMDINLPDADGIDLISELKGCHNIPVIVISSTADKLTLNACIKSGAAGFVQKSAQISSYVNAVNIILAGGQFFPQSYIGALVASEIENVGKLTERQRQILDLLISGRTNKMIAKSLCLAEGTVRNHVSDLFTLFDVESRSQLAFEALQRGYKLRMTRRDAVH